MHSKYGINEAAVQRFPSWCIKQISHLLLHSLYLNRLGERNEGIRSVSALCYRLVGDGHSLWTTRM